MEFLMGIELAWNLQSVIIVTLTAAIVLALVYYLLPLVITLIFGLVMLVLSLVVLGCCKFAKLFKRKKRKNERI